MSLKGILPRTFVGLSLLPLTLIALLRTIFYTPIYFDGSFFIFYNLLKGEYSNPDNWGRVMGHYVLETPALLLRDRIFSDFATATYFYSACVVFLPLLMIFFSYLLLEKEKKKFFVFPLLSYCFLLITSLYFEVNEIHLANGFLWMIAALLIRKDLNLLGLILLTVLMIAICFTYPLLLVCAPAFTIYLWQAPTSRTRKTFLSLLFFLSLIITLAVTIHHGATLPSSTQNFSQSLKEVWYNHSSLLSGLLTLCLLGTHFIKRREVLIYYVLAAPIFFIGLWNFQFFQHHLYDGRAVAALICGTLFSFVLLFHRMQDINLEAWIKKSYLVLVLTIIASSFYLWEWKLLREEILTYATTHTGIVEWEDFSKDHPRFANSCTHWNAEMFTVLIQHLDHRRVNFIVRKHPDLPQSFYDWWGPEKFWKELEARGIKKGH